MSIKNKMSIKNRGEIVGLNECERGVEDALAKCPFCGGDAAMTMLRCPENWADVEEECYMVKISCVNLSTCWAGVESEWHFVKPETGGGAALNARAAAMLDAVTRWQRRA